MAKIQASGLQVHSGRIGRDLLVQTWKGISYVRRKPWPKYTNTPRQAEVRGALASAVHLWQGMPFYEKLLWRLACKGKGMSGYELFISEYIKNHT